MLDAKAENFDTIAKSHIRTNPKTKKDLFLIVDKQNTAPDIAILKNVLPEAARILDGLNIEHHVVSYKNCQEYSTKLSFSIYSNNPALFEKGSIIECFPVKHDIDIPTMGVTNRQKALILLIDRNKHPFSHVGIAYLVSGGKQNGVPSPLTLGVGVQFGGKLGTGSFASGHLMAHEIGHCINLTHLNLAGNFMIETINRYSKTDTSDWSVDIFSRGEARFE